MEKKICKSCNVERNLNEFYFNVETKRSLACCKPCRRKYQRKYYKNNRDKVLENSKIYYQKNKEMMQEYNEDWRKRHPDKVKEYNQRGYGHRYRVKMQVHRIQSYA